MKKITRMIVFIVISFLVIGLYFALTLFLLSLLINSNLNIYLKVILMALSYFILIKVLYPMLISGTFIGALPKNLIYPKFYLPLVILFSIGLILYTVINYSYILNNDYSFFSIQTLIIGFFVMSAYDLLSSLINLYRNSIKPRIKQSNIEIRYGIYKDMEYLLKRDNFYYQSPYKDGLYWEKEFDSENKSLDDYEY